MWLDIFIFGTVWFWLLTVGAFFTIVYLIEGDFKNGETNGSTATFILLLFGVAYFFLGSNQHVIDLVDYIKNNPVNIFMYLGFYYCAGIIWSIIKWYFFLKFKAAQITKEIKRYNNVEFEVPQASDYKGTIIAWMSYWPFSLIYTLTWKFFHNAYEFIYMQVEKVYNKIASSVYKDVYEAKDRAKRKDK